MSMCKHCGITKITRPRGLCWSCYYTAGVREQYESKNPSASAPAITARLAPTPCPFPAGSEERIQCYADRAAKGFAIFHPLDNSDCLCKEDRPGTGNRRGFHIHREYRAAS